MPSKSFAVVGEEKIEGMQLKAFLSTHLNNRLTFGLVNRMDARREWNFYCRTSALSCNPGNPHSWQRRDFRPHETFTFVPIRMLLPGLETCIFWKGIDITILTSVAGDQSNRCLQHVQRARLIWAIFGCRGLSDTPKRLPVQRMWSFCGAIESAHLL